MTTQDVPARELRSSRRKEALIQEYDIRNPESEIEVSLRTSAAKVRWRDARQQSEDSLILSKMESAVEEIIGSRLERQSQWP